MIRFRGYDISALFFTILAIPFFKPGYFDSIPILDDATNILRLVFSIIVFFLYFLLKKWDKYFVVLALFELSFLISTLLNHGSIYTYVKSHYMQLTVFALFCICSEYPREIIRALFYLGEALTYINLFTIVWFQDGLYTNVTANWFLGFKNYFFPFYWVFMFASILYHKYIDEISIRPYFLVFGMMGSLIMANSSTSLLILVVFLLLYFAVNLYELKVINSILLYFINTLLFIVVVVFRAIDYFSFIIVTILNKNLTLSGRTRVWDIILDLIKKKPIFGWGCMSMDDSILLVGLTAGTHAHNTILQFLYTGGVVSVGLFLAFNLLVMKKLFLYRELFIAKILSIAVFTYFIGCLTETYANGIVYIMFAFACCVDRFITIEIDNPRCVSI